MTFLKGKKRRLRLPAAIIIILIGFFSTPAAVDAAQEIQSVENDTSAAAVTDSSSDSGTIPFKLPIAGSNSLNILGLVGKTIGYLALIVLLIIGLVYFLKNFVYNKRESGAKGNAVKVLSSTYVSPKKSVLLIEAVGRVLLVSVTDSNMALLTEINKEEYAEFLQNNEVNSPKKELGLNQFNEVFTKVLKRSK